MNKEYKRVSFVYKFSIIVLIIYLALNILVQLLSGFICRISDVIYLLNFPCLYIFLTILFLWSIHLRHKKASKTQPNHEESYLIIILKALCLLIYLTSIFMQLISLFVPLIFYSSQLLILIIFAIIFPFHVYSNLIKQRNHPFLMCAAVGILPIIDLALNFMAVKFYILLILLMDIAIIWNLYIIGLWQNPQAKWVTTVNSYNPFTNQVFPNSYRSNFMQMMRLSGLANLLFLIYAYLSIICVQPLGIF